MKNRVRVFVEFMVLSMNINKINNVLKTCTALSHQRAYVCILQDYQ